MDNCHNYATTSKKKRIPISDDIHIIIKKFRDKDKHDEKPSTSGDHDYDDEHSMDSEELKRVRHQEPSSSSTLVGVTSNSSNSNSTTCPTGGIGTLQTVQVQVQPQQQIISIGQQQAIPPNSSAIACSTSNSNSTHSAAVGTQSEDIKLILKKLTNIEELLKVVTEQTLSRLTALKQEVGANPQLGGAGTGGGSSSGCGQLATLEPGTVSQPPSVEIESCFKFPLRSLKELIELNKSICGDESLYNKLFEHLTKIRLDCDQNIVMNALTSIVSDEVLDSVTWDSGKKFKLSSVVLFSDSLYVAWFKDKMKYDEYVIEMKEAIERSHKRHAKVKTKRNQQNQQQQQQQPQAIQQTATIMHSPLGTNSTTSTTTGAVVSSISSDNSALAIKMESLE